MKYILNLIVCFSIATAIYSQEVTNNIKDNQFLIDDSKLSIYLSYVKTAKRKPIYQGESETGVWLKLNNNTNWNIRFCGGSFDRDNDAYLMYYDIEVIPSWKDRIKDVNIPIGYKRPHICMMETLQSGKSYIFSVPKEHVAMGLKIKVMYQYEWEKLSSSEPDHSVNFFGNSLPE